MPKYQGNNIIFRIASSDAISKFKSVQAHSFLQLTRKELDFNASSREIVLLEYERLSSWIFKMEKVFQTVSDKSVPPLLKKTIVDAFKEEVYMIEHVAAAYPDTFDETVVRFTRLIHKYSFGIILDRMDNAMLQKVDRAFTEVVEIISNYLQHLLVCFHEYNNNIIRKQSPFICVADFCMTDLIGDRRFGPINKRLKFFEDQLGNDSFIVKNYSSYPNIFPEVKQSVALNVHLVPEVMDVTENAVNSCA